MRHESLALGFRGDAGERLVRRLLVRSAAPVKRPDRALVLEPYAEAFQLLAPDALGELSDRARKPLERRVDDRLGGAGLEELEAVIADVRDRVQADDPPCLGRAPPRDTRDEAIARLESLQQGACPRGNRGRIGVDDDRRKRAVDVEKERRAQRLGDEGI
jgi:hypothetical protein